MAEIDSSIYSNMKTPDFLGSFEKGMKLSEMHSERKDKDEEKKKKKTIESAFSKGLKQNADGSMSMDQNAVVKELGNAGYGTQAYEAQNNFQKQTAEQDALKWNKVKQQNEMTGQLLNGVTDQATYDAAKAQAQQYGMDVSQLPPQYNPQFVDQAKQRVLSVQQQIANQMQNQQFEYGKTKDVKDFALKEKELVSRSLDRKEARDERRFTAGVARNDKKENEAKLSEKQVGALTDLDEAKSDLNNLLVGLGNNSEWTGPVDGRTPDMLVGADQVAWRSALGKYKDAYRKAVTGAGAGPGEIAILEKRLPSETDTLEAFKAKAHEAENEIERRRNTALSNMEKSGKNVTQFKAILKLPAVEVEEAHKWAKQNPNDPRAKEILSRIGGK